MCDAYFGKLLDYFDAHDMWQDTCLILTTDHGFLLSEHDWWGKNLMPYYEEISHIPLIVHHPDLVGQAGTRCGALTQTTDLMPSLLDVHGVATPPEVTGHSIFATLSGAARHDALAFGMFGGPVGITDGAFSYFLYPKDLFDESLGEYTLMPLHMQGFFDAKELATAQAAPAFDFTKGAALLRYDALNEARRPPGLDGRRYEPFQSALYHNEIDPNQLCPIRDDAHVARLKAQIAQILQRHDAPQEFFAWIGLENPNETHQGGPL
jgi:hypothetical protein